MADPVIRLKRSAVAGKRPTLANVELGEVALNTYDGNLFTRQDTGGVGIGTTVTLLTPWQESYGAASISYDGDVNVTGVITASDGRLIAGVGISSEGTYIGSGVTAFNFIGAGLSSVTVPSAGFSTVKIDFNGLTGIFAKTENKFSATEGQTSFPINYEIGYIDVFLNGVRLNSDNFTATDGSTVGLTTAASAGDAVDIIVYEPQSSATPKRVVTNATATAGQTVFTVPSYDTGSNSMDVFLNGIKLDSAEFTETNGTTVTLAVGAALNDELQFISYESDNNFWSLNGSTLHRTSPSNPVAIGTDTSAGDYLTVGQPGAAGTSLFVHGGARITGILTVGTGSVTIDGSTNKISGLSGGLTFNGTDTLDDYEEGIWTPAYETTGTNFSSVTYDTNNTKGYYIKVGKMVMIYGVLRTVSVTRGSASGNVIITGIPFAPPTGRPTRSPISLSEQGLFGTFFTQYPQRATIYNNPYIALFVEGSTNVIAMGQGNINHNSSKNFMMFSGVYEVN